MQFLGNNRFAPYAFYLLATLPVFLPLLGSGFILVLDMVFAPNIPMPAEPSNTYPFYALLHILNLVIPAFIIQKLLLISIFTLAGVGGYKLLRFLQLDPSDPHATAHPSLWQWAVYVGGLLYMYNPFTYTRLMAGQYLVLLGYALLPFFVRRLLMLTENPGLKHALWLAGATTLIAVTSIHTLGIALIVALVVFAVQIASRSGRKKLVAL